MHTGLTSHVMIKYYKAYPLTSLEQYNTIPTNSFILQGCTKLIKSDSKKKIISIQNPKKNNKKMVSTKILSIIKQY